MRRAGTAAGVGRPGRAVLHLLSPTVLRARLGRAAHAAGAFPARLHLVQVGLQTDDPREVRVYVFRDLASFKPYRPFKDDDYGVAVGYHVEGPDANHIAYFTLPGEVPMQFAAHEYIHAVVAREWITKARDAQAAGARRGR